MTICSLLHSRFPHNFPVCFHSPLLRTNSPCNPCKCPPVLGGLLGAFQDFSVHPYNTDVSCQEKRIDHSVQAQADNAPSVACRQADKTSQATTLTAAVRGAPAAASAGRRTPGRNASAPATTIASDHG